MADDPYLTSNDEYVTNMTTWPSMEYGYIFGYFVTRSGVYTQQELLSWKQIDVYNFFQVLPSQDCSLLSVWARQMYGCTQSQSDS